MEAAVQAARVELAALLSALTRALREVSESKDDAPPTAGDASPAPAPANGANTAAAGASGAPGAVSITGAGGATGAAGASGAAASDPAQSDQAPDGAAADAPPKPGAEVMRRLAALQAASKVAFDLGDAAAHGRADAEAAVDADEVARLQQRRDALRALISKENDQFKALIDNLRHLHRDVSIIVDMKAKPMRNLATTSNPTL